MSNTCKRHASSFRASPLPETKRERTRHQNFLPICHRSPSPTHLNHLFASLSLVAVNLLKTVPPIARSLLPKSFRGIDIEPCRNTVHYRKLRLI
ncbi:hypothetical protein F2Q69_00027906 [Brassica cretica]|uniref:Uncharacterized protein n=1 Tax=Brassica cretica TaxID=69181 RepID=A0A8S9RVT9_BRACR|nr:hypothetical protein F2Q69_00027906 [Brassica cretica]